MAKRESRLLFLIGFLLIIAPAAAGQSNQVSVGYTVEVADTERQLFHVTTEVKNIRQSQLNLSLPVWTPGWYTIENYAKNILRFQITDAKGTRLPHRMIRKQTWQVDTKGIDSIKIEFDYRATLLALNQARIAKDFAFFTGTQLFLMAEGHRNIPSTVRFKLPEGWQIISALKETQDPMTFTAPDYDTLLDSPTEMGRFDLAKFEVEGKPHYLVASPAGVFSKEKTEKFKEILTKIARTQSAIFGGLPYEKFVYYYFFTRAESNAGGALEHNNSFVAFSGAGPSAQPESLSGTAAHEFFHVWNVKRIRPAEMWPYDYSRENESPLLWVSEGFTTYYTNVTLYRAGLINKQEFVSSVNRAINGVENNPARAYISPADASTSTWLGYDTPVAFGISYYTQGQNLGALLDLSIIHDTAGVMRLDDVMRTLWRDFYKKDKGFKMDDVISIISRLTKRDYRDFFRRYIQGVEVPPYDEILGYAGYRAEKQGSSYQITEVATPSPDQLKVRDAWMKIN
jgi:predicted metalloprotease with PDZ domain